MKKGDKETGAGSPVPLHDMLRRTWDAQRAYRL